MFKSRVLCDVFEKQYASVTEAITSASILTMLGIVGGIGNILVIVVYCVKPRPRLSRPYIVITPPNAIESTGESMTPPSPIGRRTFTSRKRPADNTQTHLILVLAIVDLLTCLLILPWDVLRSVHYVIHNNKTMNSNTDFVGVTEAPYLTLSSTSYTMDEILTLLRNLAFAGEGSILAAIALDRFIVLVPRAQLSCKQLFCVSCNKSQTSNNNRDTQSSVGSRMSDSEAPSIANNSKSFCSSSSVNERRNSTICCRECSLPICTGQINQCRIVWGMIFAVCSTVFALELLILVLHFLHNLCGVANVLRELVDKVYIVSTMISFLLITYMYLSIFLIVRRTDIRKQSWRSAHKSEPLVTHTTPVADGMNKSINSKNSDESSTEMDGPDNRSPFDVARRYKYVSFTGTTQPLVIDAPEENEQDNPEPPANQFIAFSPQPSKKDTKPNTPRSRRTGLMLFITTVVFYATLFPLIMVHVRWWFEDNKYSSRSTTPVQLSTTEMMTTQMTSQLPKETKLHSRVSVHHEFYYINNAINVFIYSMLNSRFRERVRLLVSHLAMNRRASDIERQGI